METFTTQSADGLNLSGRIFTPPKTPKAVVSLVHGLGEHCGRYAPMADALNAQGFAVVAIDLRGHGVSDGKRGVCRRYESFREDLTSLLDKTRSLFPEIPHFLYGHSMGGGLVLNAVLTTGRAELRGVIASAPLISLAEPPPKFVTTLAKVLRKILPSTALSSAISGEKVSALPDAQTRYETDPLNHGYLGLGLAVDMIAGGHWVSEQAGQWDTPLLLMHARQDQLTAFSGSEAFAARAQNCTFIAFEDVEHEMHNDSARAEVYAAMIKFIKANI